MVVRNTGDGTFRDATNLSGVGGCDDDLFRMDHSPVRLQQRWMEGPLRCAGARDGYDPATSPNLTYMQPPLLLRNESGHFTRVITGDAFQKDWAGRGAAFGDIDNDGDIDVIVSNLGQNAYMLRNDGGSRQNWIGIETFGKKSNRDGIGSRVKVISASGVTQYFTVNMAVGYLSASDKRLVVGLGVDSTAK
jgi:enediyne biosynthesis protein E4